MWRYYKQLNDMQEEMENIYMNIRETYSVDFSEQRLSIHQKEGKWDVEVFVRGDAILYNVTSTGILH